jgi:hypothetical protein
MNGLVRPDDGRRRFNGVVRAATASSVTRVPQGVESGPPAATSRDRNRGGDRPGLKAEVTEFLAEFELTVPEGTPESDVNQREPRWQRAPPTGVARRIPRPGRRERLAQLGAPDTGRPPRQGRRDPVLHLLPGSTGCAGSPSHGHWPLGLLAEPRQRAFLYRTSPPPEAEFGPRVAGRDTTCDAKSRPLVCFLVSTEGGTVTVFAGRGASQWDGSPYSPSGRILEPEAGQRP